MLIVHAHIFCALSVFVVLSTVCSACASVMVTRLTLYASTFDLFFCVLCAAAADHSNVFCCCCCWCLCADDGSGASQLQFLIDPSFPAGYSLIVFPPASVSAHQPVCHGVLSCCCDSTCLPASPIDRLPVCLLPVCPFLPACCLPVCLSHCELAHPP